MLQCDEHEGTKRSLAVILAVAALLGVPGSALGDGGTIYRQVCAACHATGVAGAPKLGDKKDWAPRLGLGRDALIVSVLRGKGQMPPKGGNVSLSDEDVESAMDFMLSQAR